MKAATNPFDDEYTPTYESTSRRHYDASSTKRSTGRHGSVGVATTSSSIANSNTSSALPTTGTSTSISSTMTLNDDPIWMARPVEWPLPSSLPSSIYWKLVKSSQVAGLALGVSSDAWENLGAAVGANDGTGSGNGRNGHVDGEEGDGNGSHSNQMVGSASGGGYYNPLGGIMGKFMGSSGNGASGAVNNTLMASSNLNDKEEYNRQRNQQHYPLYPPRNRCVAAANGWVVASLECAPIQHTPPSSSSTQHSSHHPSHSSSQVTSPLRLISRWNVRRNNNTSSNMRDHLISLPPPLFDRDHAKIMHVFVDPTGCHTIVSALNGEAYYIHANKRYASKLIGFGATNRGDSGGGGTSMGGDWNNTFQPGISCMEASTLSDKDKSKVKIQMGLTPGSYITSVGWDKHQGTEGSTKKILLGNNYGEIYEYSLVNTRSANDGMNVEDAIGSAVKDKMNIFLAGGDELPMLLVRLNSIGSDRNSASGAVTGLYFTRLNVESRALERDDGNDDLIVLATTSGTNLQTRLHTYVSVSSLSTDASESASSSVSRSAFRKVFSSSETTQNSFVELPGSIRFADLQICDNGFALKTETGIYHGTIASDSIEKRSKGSFGILDAGILPYENKHIPVSIAVTPHHLITLNETNELRFVSRVAKKTIQMERVDWVSTAQPSAVNAADDEMFSFGQYGELLTDIRRPDQVWFRTSRALVHISSTCEDRDVWKFTLRRCLEKSKPPNIESEFDHAKDLCSNDAQRAVVTAARAEFHLAHGRVELASKYMAQCPSALMPFVETSVRLGLPKLVNFDRQSCDPNATNSNIGLINYLSDKMRSSKTSNDSVACTMIGSWLVELFLHERETGFSPHMLQQFLSSNVDYMDASTIVQILSSHDVVASECAQYAAKSGHIGTAVNAAFCMADSRGGALDALRVLNDAPFEQAESFYYRHAFTLLSRVPMEASKSFLGKYTQGLSATKLLPSLMQYESEASHRHNEQSVKALESYDIQHDQDASIKYLEGVIKLGCESTAVYNYLVSLYSRMDDEEPLFDFLSSHISTLPSKPSDYSSHLDLSYILRQVLRTGRHYRSVVKLYMGLGMRQRAVELAIKVDPELAKELARESNDTDEKKRLWLMIARNAAADAETADGKEVVSKVLSILGECGTGILSIEDVLPFLPDVAQIDQFKDEICDALTSYSSRIEQYLIEMSECDHTCQTLREEIANLNDYKTEMKSNARCAFSQKIVMDQNEPFYVFPSGYVTLESSLKQEVFPYLNTKQRSRLESIEKELIEIQRDEQKIDDEMKHELDVLQAELDGLIAAECPLTGAVMVESIDRSFLDDKEDKRYCLTGSLLEI